MNRSDNQLPWFLVLALSTVTACGDSFRQLLCVYNSEQPECSMMNAPLPDMISGDGPPTGDMDKPPTPRMKKGPVGFTLVAETPLSATRNWVGVRPDKQLAFIEKTGTTVNIKRLTLAPSTSTKPVWTLGDSPACQGCLKTIPGFDFSQDYLVAGSSSYFLLRYGSVNGYVKSYPDDENIPNISHSSGVFINFRPFGQPNANIFLYQRSIGIGDSQTGLISVPNAHNIVDDLLASRTDYSIPPLYTSCTVGNLTDKNELLEQSQILISQNDKLAGAYRITKEKEKYLLDLDLTKSVNAFFALDGDDKKIRGMFIADLNSDGYMELIYGRGNLIYIGTYDPSQSPAFLGWGNPIDVSKRVDERANPELSDRPRSISAVDLNNDGFLDLVAEIVDGSAADYTKEAQKRVAVFLNNKN